MDNKKNKCTMTTEGWTYLNGKLISYDEKKTEEVYFEWKMPSEDPMFQNMLNNISIGSLDPTYLEVNEIQDKNDEYKKIKKFLQKYITRYSEIIGVSVEDLKLEFINYGKTELVYVLTEKSGRRTTLLVKQPIVEFGKVKQEAKNLLILAQSDKNIVAPIDYFRLGDQELYATPYINQARCIASDGCYGWGMHIPEPFYRFVPFTEEQEKIVTACMIAKLVSLYDFINHEGISSCKLGGGDFMLPKGWETEKATIENTLRNLYLTAARDKVKCSFYNYLQLIKSEFSRRTINEDSKNLIMNIRGKVPIKPVDIESGILLGQSIIQRNNLSKNTQLQKTADFER